MSERRPHWDIDLVEGVGRRLIPRYRSIGYCTDAERDRIYTLIEFVEDWRNSNIQVHWQGMTATERNLSEALGREQRGRAELEAAIARVREIPEKDPYRPGGLGVEYRLGWNDALRHVLRALDGEQ